MTDSIRYKVAVIGASETTELGNVPGMSDMMALICRECGESVDVPHSVQ